MNNIQKFFILKQKYLSLLKELKKLNLLLNLHNIENYNDFVNSISYIVSFSFIDPNIKNERFSDEEMILKKHYDSTIENRYTEIMNDEFVIRSNLEIIENNWNWKSWFPISKKKDMEKDIDLTCSMIFSLNCDKDRILNGLLERVKLINETTLVIINVYPSPFTTPSEIKVHLKDKKVIYIEIGLNRFIENLRVYLQLIPKPSNDTDLIHVSPIIIFHGMTWGLILSVFKTYNYNIYGGRISNRHKLSMTDFKLSLFLNYIGYTWSKKLFYIYYNENLFSKNTFDKDLYKAFKTLDNNLISKDYNKILLNNEEIKNHLRSENNYSNLYSIYRIIERLKEIKLNIENYDLQLKEKINKINETNSKVRQVENIIISLKEKIENKNEKKEKHRGIINSKIKAKKEEQILLKKEITTLYADKSNFIKSFDSYLNEVIKLLEEYEKNYNNFDLISEEDQEIYSNELKGTNLIKNYFKEEGLNKLKDIIIKNKKIEETNDSTFDRKKNWKVKDKINKRHYSTTPIRSYFKIDSPIFLELKRLLSNNELNNESQAKIEQYLFNQGQIVFNDKLEEVTDINYNKLNKTILNHLKEYLSVLDLKLNNLKETQLNNKNFKSDDLNIINGIYTKVSNHIIISILIGRVLKIISNYSLVNKNTIYIYVAIDIAKDILNNYLSNLHSLLEKENKTSFGEFLINNNYMRYKNDSTFLFNFGSLFIEILLDIELLFIEIKQVSKTEKNNILIPNKSLRFDITKLKLLDLPYKIPMIVPPKEYKLDLKSNKEILGGYFLNDIIYTNPLIIENSNLRDSSIIMEQSNIYNMVNTLNRVAYKINTHLLEFILESGLNYNLIIDPKIIEELELEKNKLTKKFTLLKHLKENKNNQMKSESIIKELQIENNDFVINSFNEFDFNYNIRIISNKINKINKELESFITKYRLELNILGLAQLFREIPEFYIPVRLDNRGRVYCITEYLNYQGTDLAKSLLLFSKGEKILKSDTNSINYLKVFGANCYGYNVSKNSFNYKIEWINKNESDILDFKNGKLIKEAENKPLFLAFCFEYRNYYNSLSNDKNYYISHFPIQLDATCNGYQHLALLIGEDSLATEVNLNESNKDEKPKDFYAFIALKLKSYFREKIIDIKSNKCHNELINLDSYKRLLNMDLHRKLVKTPIMVRPYNATLYRASQYVKEQFAEEIISINYDNEQHIKDQLLDEIISIDYDSKNEKNINKRELNKKNIRVEKWFIHKEFPQFKLREKDFMLLIKSIEIILYKEFPKLLEFNNYLREIAKICCSLNIPILWTLPSGLKVNQYYIDSDKIRIKPFIHRKNTFSLKIPNKNLNINKQIRALMPNLIHSLDAASLALLVEIFTNEIERFYPKINDKIINNMYTIHDCFAVTANNIEILFDCLKYVYLKIYSEDTYLKKFDQGIIKNIKAQFGENSFNEETLTIKVNDLNIKYPDINKVLKGKIASLNIKHSEYILK